MRKFLILFLVAVMAFAGGVALAANETIEDTYIDGLSTVQEDQLNRLGAPSAIASTRRVQLGTLLDELAQGTSKIDTYNSICAPASGADSGSIMAIHDARSAVDCGNVGGGAYLNVCISDGTNWIDLT